MRTPSKPKKLLKGELVEVRQEEEGLRGAWHEGIVIESSIFHRTVKYTHLLDDNSEDVLVESVGVSPAVEGWPNAEGDRSQQKQRGYIRPFPPPPITEVRWERGLSVDALYNNAWWEAVIMDDSENSPERSVLFPDEGFELMIPRENLRVTQDWDETQGEWGEWCVRGHWMKTSASDQFNSEDGSKLSPQISRRCRSQPAKSTIGPSANFISEDCLEAILNYDPVSNSSKEIKAKAKIYLNQQGWRMEVKGRTSSERQDVHYVSPKGNIYNSLNLACLGWKEERNNGGSKINNRSRQLVSRSKKLGGDVNKRRRVAFERSSASELTHGTQTRNFLSNSVVRDFEIKKFKNWRVELKKI